MWFTHDGCHRQNAVDKTMDFMLDSNDGNACLIVTIFTLQSESDRCGSKITIIFLHRLCYGRIQEAIRDWKSISNRILWNNLNHNIPKRINKQNRRYWFDFKQLNKWNIQILPVLHTNHCKYLVIFTNRIQFWFDLFCFGCTLCSSRTSFMHDFLTFHRYCEWATMRQWQFELSVQCEFIWLVKHFQRSLLLLLSTNQLFQRMYGFSRMCTIAFLLFLFFNSIG